MKKILAAAVLFANLAVPALADTVTMRADTWCPFNCDPKAADKGFILEIAEYALSKKGHKVDYQIMPWARTTAETGAGRVDAAIAANDQDVKDNHLVVGKETVGVSVNCIFAKNASTATYAGSADLKKFKKIATVQDYDYGDDIKAVFAANKGLSDAISGDDPPAMNIRKLNADRVEAVLEDGAVMAYTLNKLGEKSVKKVGCEPKNIPLYLAFSPKNPKTKEYVAAIDEGIVELRKSGKLKAIMAKYGLTDWK